MKNVKWWGARTIAVTITFILFSANMERRVSRLENPECRSGTIEEGVDRILETPASKRSLQEEVARLERLIDFKTGGAVLRGGKWYRAEKKCCGVWKQWDRSKPMTIYQSGRGSEWVGGANAYRDTVCIDIIRIYDRRGHLVEEVYPDDARAAASRVALFDSLLAQDGGGG